MMSDIRQIAIIGMGLIGGSLGLAIKAAPDKQFRIIGIDTNPVALDIARQRGAADTVTTDFQQGVSEADIIFLCTPVLQIPAIVEKIAPHIKQGAILTDTGSTKRFLIDQITGILPQGVHYVPGHPMAGREQSGMQAANATLFQEKWYILISQGDDQAIETIRQIVQCTGARVTTMNATEHDSCTALISHIPHIGAAAMVNLLRYAHDQESSIKLAGGGFRDTTRIASSNADMWADICMTNAGPIADSLDKFSEIISQVAAAVRQGDRQAIHTFFANAKLRRDELLLLEQAASAQPLSTGH